MLMLSLVENECLKILRRHRFTIIVSIMLVVMSLVAYGYYRQMSRHADENWRAVTEQRIAHYKNHIRREGPDSTWSRSLRAEIARLQFYVDHDINPERATAPMFVRRFPSAAGFLLLPLLISVLGSDIVSGERNDGTDKLLLTRPVRRWKILTSKTLVLFLFSTLTLVVGTVISYGVSSIVLDPRGWQAPVFTGFQISDTGLTFNAVHQLPLWLDTVIALGLEWFALLAVASIALLLSVLFRSSAASMGTMLAALIAGTILTRVTPDWTAGKYLFVSAVPLAAYYGGEAPPYAGMSLGFCIVLLGVWAVGSLIAAFVIFTRRDVLG